jgi:sugar phosphate isomerase/epimerase
MRRRTFLQAVGLSPVLAGIGIAAEPAAPARMTLGYGTYGMPGVSSEDAIGRVAAIGFDSIELDCRVKSDADPSRVDDARRKVLRQKLGDSGLALRALMIELRPSADAALHAAALDELKRAAQLAHELSPDAPPLLQTVLGGGKWDDLQKMYVERLADWARTAEQTRTMVAIKPHRFGALSQPAQAVWIFEQLGKPAWLRMVYDYSHYAYRDLPLEETIRTALPYMAHVAAKDAVEDADKKVSFALAGETGKIDFPTMLRLFQEGGYRGDVCCEVSRSVWSQPGFDATAAARTCYKNMAAAFEKAGVSRK